MTPEEREATAHTAAWQNAQMIREAARRLEECGRDTDDEFIAALRECANRVSTARLREQGLREAATLVANSMGDVVTLGRFSRSVDPVRLVTAWHTDLCYAIHAALALPEAGTLKE